MLNDQSDGKDHHIGASVQDGGEFLCRLQPTTKQKTPKPWAREE